jgi:hypothetical protein
MEIGEHGRESAEHVHEHGPPQGFTRRVALLIAALAAALALTESGVQSAQTAYIAHNIGASDNWTFYGFKETRARIAEQTATILGSLPGPPDEARQSAISQAQATIKRMHDGDATGPGTRQIQETAETEQAGLEHAFHRYHYFEYAASALQIAIVLGSAAVVSQVGAIAVAGGVLGAAGALLALAVAAGFV